MSTKLIRVQLTQDNPNVTNIQVFAVTGTGETLLTAGELVGGGAVTSLGSPEHYWDKSDLLNGIFFTVDQDVVSIKMKSNNTGICENDKTVDLLDDCYLYIIYDATTDSQIIDALTYLQSELTLEEIRVFYPGYLEYTGFNEDMCLRAAQWFTFKNKKAQMIAAHTLADLGTRLDYPVNISVIFYDARAGQQYVDLRENFECGPDDIYRLKTSNFPPELLIYRNTVGALEAEGATLVQGINCSYPGSGTGTVISAFPINLYIANSSFETTTIDTVAVSEVTKLQGPETDPSTDNLPFSVEVCGTEV
jgi:hypothetical protein